MPRLETLDLRGVCNFTEAHLCSLSEKFPSLRYRTRVLQRNMCSIIHIYSFAEPKPHGAESFWWSRSREAKRRRRLRPRPRCSKWMDFNLKDFITVIFTVIPCMQQLNHTGSVFLVFIILYCHMEG
jgi:hypothetical protein